MTAKETVSRWSDQRFTNMDVPSYVPPVALVHESGQFMRALLLRVAVHDLQRLLATKSCDQYFANIPIDPRYDPTTGDRTNRPEDVVNEKLLHAIEDIGKLLQAYHERQEYSKSKEITRKIYFTAEQMETGDHNALIGARGAVHQMLERETRCKIVLGGRGITNPMKDTSPNAAALALEDPHVRITATSEDDLQTAAERVEWILSDDPEAEEFREKNRRRTAQVEGRYDPRTWMSAADRKAAGEAAKKGEKRQREEEEEAAEDAAVDKFLEDL